MSEKDRTYIKIVDTPPGPAPVEIRAGWLGVVMPTVTTPSDITIEGIEHRKIGSFIRAKLAIWSSDDNKNGHVVRARDALIALDSENTAIAEVAWAYWAAIFTGLENNGMPIDKQRLRFSKDVCEEVDESELKPFPY